MITKSTIANVVIASVFAGLSGQFAVVGTGVRSAHGNERWVGTWSATPAQPSPGPPQLTNSGFTNQTLRQIVRVTLGGNRVRVRLSTFGAGRLVIGAAHIALR